MNLETVEQIKGGKREWFEACFEHVTLEGQAAEFGVYRGKSISLLAEYISEVHGFDSFEGLPEDWVKADDTVVSQGKFAAEVPNVPDNVVLHVGLFEDTIDGNIKENLMFMHVDCDLYSSAKTVLEKCNDFIVPGTVIVMDDYRSVNPAVYPNWEEGEHKALVEWCDKYSREVRPVLRDGFQAFCFVVDK